MREMKDSGILGVGKVPISWEQTRLGYECYIRARLGWRGLKADEYVDEGYAFISAFNIQDGKLVWEPLNYITQERYDESPEIKLNIGDVLLVKDGAGVGKSARVDSLPCGGTAPNSSIGVITPYNSMSYRYVCYYIQSPVFSNFVGLLYNGMGVPHLTQEILKTIRILMPPLDEQQSICDYLDEKCAEFDTIKSDIQSQIEALEEYKRSVITEAVTKGLDPDVEMRDNGVQWIGEIPTHWTLIRIGSLYGLRTQKVNDVDYPPLSVTKMGVLPQLDTVAKTNAHDDRKLVVKGDFVINSRSDRRGSCGISDYTGSVSLINTVLYPITEMNPRYYNWYFHTVGFADEFYRWGHGIVDDLWTTGWQDMKNILISVPPLDEQQQIADYLDSKCAEIDSIIAEKKQQIETIEEYKKSLIFEYVTGKKEVQE